MKPRNAREKAEVRFEQALALQRAGHNVEAMEHYGRAIALAPGHVDARNNRGILQILAGDLDAALASFGAVLKLDPGHANALVNRGIIRLQRNDLSEAMADFEAALALNPENAAALHNRGLVLARRLKFAEALESFEAALAIDPGNRESREYRLVLRLGTLRWDNFEAERAALLPPIAAGHSRLEPFRVLALTDDPATLLAATRAWVRTKGLDAPAPALPPHPASPKLRIGYFSADYHNHATMHLIADMLENHDRSRFEISLFSFGPDRDDPWRIRALASADRFLDISDKNDAEVVALARKLAIDVAVDLKGFTLDSRPGLFTGRLAPLQASWLGYAGSTAMPAMDYLLADHVVVTPENRRFFTEAIVRLQGSYQPNNNRRAQAGPAPDRSSMGLADQAMVYCCFNQGYKILPHQFEIWMRILKAVDGAQLWLWIDDEGARHRLRAAAAGHGVDLERIVFAGQAPVSAHLARLPLADLFLDTLPLNAHTTASDALGMGLPVLTCPGGGFASRVAASLVKTAGLDDLIAKSPADYEALAIALGHDAARRKALRRRAEAAATSPLFDTMRFTTGLERALLDLDRRARDGLPPADIDY